MEIPRVPPAGKKVAVVLQPRPQIPAQGFDGVDHGWATLREGEQTIEAYVHAPEGGEPLFVVKRPTGASSGGIAKENFRRLTHGGASWSSAGKSLQVTSPGDDLLLLRYRTHREKIAADGSKTSRSTDEPTFGFLLWIEAEGP